MRKIKVIISSFLLLFICTTLLAQKDYSTTNLPKFDYKKYHFGFLLSYNQASFIINDAAEFNFKDSLLGLENVPQPGFNLALLASLNLTKNIRFRFVPGLSFQDRSISYRFLAPNGKISTTEKRVESVYLDFPLLLKLRTNRVGNFAAYALVGGKYSRDMQSQKNVDNEIEDEIIIKLVDDDFSIDAGFGFDFFLNYFKFGIELKTAFGLNNVLIQEDTRFSTPLDALRTRTFVLSFTFEG